MPVGIFDKIDGKQDFYFFCHSIGICPSRVRVSHEAALAERIPILREQNDKKNNLPTMKKTTFFSLAEVLTQVRAGLALLLFVIPTQEGTAQQPGTNVTVGDDAKVGLIVTGTGNTINTTQIFGKSPEYAELKKRLDGLATAITKKAERCDKYTDPVAKEDCRAELIALNTERDSVQKIETRFREDVIRLAETFSKIELNSERLRLAKQFFDEGKIREADNVLNAKEMKTEGDALLAEKAREQEKLRRTDSLLRIKADEFALKARLKATDYADSLRYDSAQIYFEQSWKYAETGVNLWDFAYLLWKDRQPQLATIYFEKALQLSRSELAVEAAVSVNLGNTYSEINEVEKAEKMYLQALDIFERLSKTYPTKVDQDIAMVTMNLGNLYLNLQKMSEAEKMYLRALEIFERLAKLNSAQFEPDLAMTAMNIGTFYFSIQKMEEAGKMYLRSLDIFERLAKSNPAQFEPDLAMLFLGLGQYYSNVQKMEESEKMFLRSLEIYERKVKVNPARYEPELALTTTNLGDFYYLNQKVEESEKMYLRALSIYEPLALANPKQFEPYLAGIFTNFGNFYCIAQKMAEAEKMYFRSLEIYERLAKSSPMQFEPYLAFTLNNFGYFRQVSGQFGEAKKMYSRGLVLRQKAVANGQTHLLSELGRVYKNMASLRDSFETRKDYATVVNIQYERAACVDSLIRVEASLTEQASQEYGSLSWYCLFARQYPESQAAAERALVLHPTQNWLRTNLGHSYLLRGEWGKAKSAYEEYLKNETDPAEAKKLLEKDWADLEAAGVTHKDMEKARAWVRE